MKCGGSGWWGWNKEVQYRTRPHKDFHHALTAGGILALCVALLVFCALPQG